MLLIIVFIYQAILTSYIPVGGLKTFNGLAIAVTIIIFGAIAFLEFSKPKTAAYESVMDGITRSELEGINGSCEDCQVELN